MSNPTVPAAAEGMPAISSDVLAAKQFRNFSQADRTLTLKVVEMLRAGEDPTRLVIARLGKETAAPILAKIAAVSGTTSEQVNALFGRYVAIEKRQHHAPENDQHADDLGAVAMAVRDLVFEIRDSTGNSDLIAARIMLDIMLLDPWNSMGSFEWRKDSRRALGTLECVAANTTGTVRQEARKALKTIGVDIEQGAGR